MGADNTNSSNDGDSADSQVSAGITPPCIVSLRLADNGQLLAELSPDQSQIPIPVTLMSLRGLLQDEAFAALWIDEAALQGVVMKAREGESGRVVVGERRDAKAQVNIAKDKRAVHVDLEPAYGGQALSHEALIDLLAKDRISANCIDEGLVAKAVAAGDGVNLAVGSAIAPVAGDDGYLKVLIEECISTLNEDEQGNVDFHKLQDFIVVEVGAELARVVPHTLGTPGEDVMGMAIAPVSGKAFKFSSSLEGAEVSSGDHNLLLATVKGHPVILKDGVRVEPTLLLPNVNLASGNIDFDGSVMVKGSVASGYEIKATGDVIVKDTVDKARIIAGGNIHVANGVIGEDRSAKPKKRPVAPGDDEEVDEEDEFEALHMGAYLSAEGDIEARFVSMAELSAGQNVKVNEYLMHCRVTAQESVLVGQSGGRGAIFGGQTTAIKSIVVNNLGNDAYIKTSVEVGEANQYAEKLVELRLQSQKRQADHDKLSVAIDKIRRYEKMKPLTDELKVKSAKIEKTLLALGAQLKKLEAAKERLYQLKANRPPATVKVKKSLFPNVTLTLDGMGYQQAVESKAICLANVEEEVVLSAFDGRS